MTPDPLSTEKIAETTATVAVKAVKEVWSILDAATEKPQLKDVLSENAVAAIQGQSPKE